MNPKIANLMTEAEAAKHLGYSTATMRQSRWTNRLCGIKSPPFKKLGRAIRYDKTELDAWVDKMLEESAHD